MSELQLSRFDIFEGPRGNALRDALENQATKVGLSLYEFLNRVASGSVFFVEGRSQGMLAVPPIAAEAASESSQSINAEDFQRIWDAQMREAVEDPVAHAKSLGELSMYSELWGTSMEDVRELW